MGTELVRGGVLEAWPNAALREDARKRFDALIRELEQGNGGQPWCGYAVDSLRRNRFLVADARSWFEEDGLQIAIGSLAALFQRCVPFKGVKSSRLDTLTALIDGGPPSIDDAVQEKREWLLQRGLMMAALHPKSDLVSLGNAADRNARPFRSEGTFLSVRWAGPADRVFTRKDIHLAALLDEWLRRWEPCR